MNKIVVAIDSLKYAAGAVEYAVKLAKKTDAQLVGVFLEDFTYHSYRLSQLMGAHGETEEEINELREKDLITRRESVDRFEIYCRQEGISSYIHHDRSIALQELLHESIYADLVVISAEETLSNREDERPTRFIRELLEQVQCPVMVVPETYNPINKIVFMFDGEPSSVAAIKAFSYLLSPLRYTASELIFVSSASGAAHLPDNRLIKEFMRCHFPTITYTLLVGDVKTETTRHLKEAEQNTLVVLGAYRRGMVSRMIRPTLADVLGKSLRSPLFIAPNK